MLLRRLFIISSLDLLSVLVLARVGEQDGLSSEMLGLGVAHQLIVVEVGRALGRL